MQQSLATVFVGRDAEVAALVSGGRAAVAGHGAVVVVEGEAGIGKTTLLGAAARQFAELGLQVRTSRARELQQDVPFAALATWLVTGDPHTDSDPVRTLLDGADQAGDAAATHEFALAELLLEQVRTWCAEQPVALLLDDVHWADRSSLAVLHRLCTLADRLPLVLVLATRPFTTDPAFAVLTATLTACAASTIRLGALPDAATTTMVREMVGAVPPPSLLRQVAGAYGHPLHITELVAASLLEAEGAKPASGSAPQPVGSLAEAIWRRAESLSRSTRDLLPMAAALGPKVDVVELAAGGRGADAREALESAVQLYTRLGASWDTARAVARIRRYGIRRGVRGPRNRPKTGWASLTDTERSVAVQVADGSSNADIAAQMFLSRRTVQSHVSSILAKLGVRSRRDIAAAMAAAGR
ncbi:AAA family ATPase [Nocardia grenadensis]